MHAEEEYVDGVRMVGGTVPYRYGPDGLEIMLESSSKDPRKA